MVTVIADKEEITKPIHNSLTNSSNDNERTFQFIKDYQEVDFHRSPSCKPLPHGLIDNQKMKSSIDGTFFLQIDSIESVKSLSNDQSKQTNANNPLILNLTDGIITVKGITIDSIRNLSHNIKPGSKLLLSGTIMIKDDLLQLTNDTTRFQYGSSTYPRPRSAYRRRHGRSYRPFNEGRRGGVRNSNNRYDHDDSASNFLKGPPPKTTLMDFMTSLKISNDIKRTNDNEHDNSKRQNFKSYHQKDNSINTTNNSHRSYHSNNNHTDQISYQEDNAHDQLDQEDDSSHSSYRERRNPLPPRFQRVQEERIRRNTNHNYDELASITGNEMNCDLYDGTTNHHSLPSLSRYDNDHMSYIPQNLSIGQQHSSAINSYASHGNIFTPVNGSTSTHLAYFPATPGSLTYTLGGIPSSPFHGQPSSINSSYPNEHLTYCFRPPFTTPIYFQSTVADHFNDNYNHSSNSQANSFVDDNETKTTNQSHQDDNHDKNTSDKSQSSLIEQNLTSSSSSSSSSNDGSNNNSQQILDEQQENKRRDSNANSRLRWRIGDICLARWSEDQEFYVATILEIQPPYCTVIFRDYNNYDKLHFSDLKSLPHDQQYYPYVQPIPVPPPDFNILGVNPYFHSRTDYYTPTIDGCIIMPEVPPFPFNSAGTLYMCRPTLTPMSRTNRYHTNGFSSIEQFNHNNIEDENMINNTHSTINIPTNCSSKPSKDSSINDSTTTSIDDNQQSQQQDLSLSMEKIRPCSIADAPLTLASFNDERQHSSSTESVSSSTYDEEKLMNEDKENKEHNTIINVNEI